MATLPKVLINRADYQIGGGVALRLRTQAVMSMSDLVYAHLLMSVALSPALVSIYVMPMLIASERGHKHVNAIVVFNILTGWTFFGWVISFVRALVEEKEVK
jgi:hypothetical protein